MAAYNSNQISKFDAIQQRTFKWIFGQCFDHYRDEGYFKKQTELQILPIKLKFCLNDLKLLYKILNSLVPINLPEHFSFMDGRQLIYTRNTADIIYGRDKTQLTCHVKPNSKSFKHCFFYRR